MKGLCLLTCKGFSAGYIKYLPTVGWSLFFTESIFLHRSYEKDKGIIVKQLKELQSYPDNFWIELNCEGTRFTAERHRAFMEVARSKGLPELKHHVLPRTKGFVLCARVARKYIQAFYDVVYHFDQRSPEPTLMEMLKGKKHHVHIYIRRIPIEEIPEDEEACAKYCHELYRIKDINYEYFEKHGRFPEKTQVIPRRKHSIFIFIFWSALLVVPPMKYLLDVIMYGSMSLIAGVFLSTTLVLLWTWWFVEVLLPGVLPFQVQTHHQ
ncbi:1-acyl-sn-glycerol-3-phosphate acyltransferase delta-like [Branchiostoma lanceolatum]|uniref:1-acyl-sn-glycerol-3-phosphate acyltransferase delta-like n=1 Tax=Branchiostoma lanceolatum TaxID=7740 RepID=UPI0034541E3B